MRKTVLFTFLSLRLWGGIIALAIDEPGTPDPAKATRDEASQHIAAETAAAIKALGTSPATKQISAIVFQAIVASPATVLPIVDATVRASPRNAAREIVTAATAAVPDPWKQVIYRRLAAPSARTSSPEHSSGSVGGRGRRSTTNEPKQPVLSMGRSVAVASQTGTGGPRANSADGAQMSLAEAIVRTAFDAEPGLSYPELRDAANAALRMDPAVLLRYIQSSRMISGVGDSGQSNYANEPLLTPRQPAVSR